MTWFRNDEVIKLETIKKPVKPTMKKKSKAAYSEPEEPYHPPLNERVSFDPSKKGVAIVMIRDSVRSDHGVYMAKVENVHGSTTASCDVNVLGKSDLINFYLL